MKNIRIKQTDKFKDTLISLRFASNDLEDVTTRSLLAMMMVDRTKKYHTKVLMNEVLDNMYGANMSARVINYGQAHVIDFGLSVLNEHFVKEDLFDAQIDFLKEVIFNPLFNEHSLKEAKINLADIMKRSLEDPSRYVIDQSLKLAGKNSPLAISKYGNLEDLDDINLEDIEKVYKKMLENDALTIQVIGDVNPTQTHQSLNELFKVQLEKKSFDHFYVSDNKGVIKAQEKRTIDQSYFSLVYNTHVAVNTDQYWASQLATMMLGQMSSSFLFVEIREKRSLSYSVFSSIIAYDAVMVVTGGVRVESLDEAVELSKQQVARLANKDFEDSLLEEAKTMIKNQLIQGQDDNNQVLNSEYRQLLLEGNQSTGEIIKVIDQVKVEDIVQCGKQLDLVTEFKLEGEINEENH